MPQHIFYLLELTSILKMESDKLRVVADELFAQIVFPSKWFFLENACYTFLPVHVSGKLTNYYLLVCCPQIQEYLWIQNLSTNYYTMKKNIEKINYKPILLIVVCYG